METFEYFTLPEAHIEEAKAEARAKFRRLTWFMSQKAKAPNLSRAEEIRLVAGAQKGCKTSLKTIVQSHESLIGSIAIRVGKESNAEHLIEDLFSIAIDALFKVIPKFDLSGQARLNTYARYRMVGDCRKFALENGGAIARGKGSQERQAYYNRRKLAQAFYRKWGYNPSTSEQDLRRLSELSNLSSKAIKRGMFGNVEAVPLHRVEVVCKEPVAEQRIQRDETNKAFSQAFQALRSKVSERDYTLTTALREEDDVSMVELGKRHGISAERAGQIVRKSAQILRQELEVRGIQSRSDLM